ncbi:hypothetical protein RHGRI_013813 [Rhododendron griersonianum]|nr:hypothetical protein RHGRI_013813 [Rhododendron griersonianum]
MCCRQCFRSNAKEIGFIKFFVTFCSFNVHYFILWGEYSLSLLLFAVSLKDFAGSTRIEGFAQAYAGFFVFKRFKYLSGCFCHVSLLLQTFTLGLTFLVLV